MIPEEGNASASFAVAPWPAWRRLQPGHTGGRPTVMDIATSGPTQALRGPTALALRAPFWVSATSATHECHRRYDHEWHSW
jgi:hypothetical protein